MFKLLCLAVFVAAANAIVCPPDACQTVRCAAVTNDNCNGVVKANGGFCGCCDACITELGEGEMCMETLLFGIPSTQQCADGLFCDPKSHLCKANSAKRELGPCAKHLASVEARLTAEPLLLGLERPHCEADGTYKGMQFSGSQAYCVTKNGTMINGYMVNRWETGDHMDCQCARDQYEYMQSGLIGKFFYCDPNGNYASHRCVGSVCYCTDTNGDMKGTQSVPIGQVDTLKC